MRRALADRGGCSPGAQGRGGWRAATRERGTCGTSGTRQWAIPARGRVWLVTLRPAGRDVDDGAQPDDSTGRAKEIEHAIDFDLCRRGIAFRRVCGVWTQAGPLAAASYGADRDGSLRVSAAAGGLPAATWRVSTANGDLPATGDRPAGLCPDSGRSDRGPAGHRRTAVGPRSGVLHPVLERRSVRSRATATSSTASASSRARQAPTASRRIPAGLWASACPRCRKPLPRTDHGRRDRDDDQ